MMTMIKLLRILGKLCDDYTKRSVYDYDIRKRLIVKSSPSSLHFNIVMMIVVRGLS